MRLTREIRLFAADATRAGSTTNSWAGTPHGPLSGAFWKLRATVEGPADPRTGFVCNILLIDDWLRRAVAPGLLQQLESNAMHRSALTSGLLHALQTNGNPRNFEAEVVALELEISPYTRFTVDKGNSDMVSITHSYEFSASHRLYCKELSEDENRRVFGKCANANGHGHNYVVEVTVSGQPDARTGLIADLTQLDRTVKEFVIDRLDHKHLNLDCREFASLNPSVENIAQVIWGLLKDAISPTRLTCVRVWETPKTCAEYRGEN